MKMEEPRQVQKMDVTPANLAERPSERKERLIKREVTSKAKGFGITFTRSYVEMVASPCEEDEGKK